MQRSFSFSNHAAVLSAVLVVAACVSPLAAKKGPGPWPEISEADRKMAAYPEAPEAPAVVLLDRRAHELHAAAPMGRVRAWSETSRLRRVKILDEAALEDWSIVNAAVAHGTDRELEWIRARTVQPDGSVVEVPASQMHDRVVYESADGDLELFERRFAFPAVRVGSVLELQWRRKDRSLSWDPWFFRGRHPVVMSALEVELDPTGFVYRVLENAVTVEIARRESEARGHRRRVVYEARDVPAFQPEPHMPAPANFLDFVDLLLVGYRVVTPSGVVGNDLASSWSRVLERRWSGWLRDSLKIEAKRGRGASRPPRTDDPRKLFAWVRENVHALPSPEEVVVHPAAQSVLEQGEAPPNGLSMLLLALLRENGQTAWPAFVIPSDRGLLRGDWPAAGMLEVMGVALPAEGDEEPIYLFPGRRHLAYGRLPWDYAGGVAIVYVPEKGETEVRPLPREVAGMEEWSAEARLEERDVSGTLRISLSGQEALAVREAHEGASAWREEMIAEVLRRRPQVELEEAVVEGWGDPAASLVMEVSFSLPSLARRDGSRLVLPSDLFPEQDEAPVGPPRHHPIFFSWDRTSLHSHEISIPQGWTLIEAPSAERSGSELLSGEVSSEVREGVLHYRRRLERARAVLPVEAAEQIAGFYDLFRRTCREPAVLERKEP